MDHLTVLGWYLKVMIYSYNCCVYCFGMAVAVTYLISCFRYIEACAKHFEIIINEVDEIVSIAVKNTEKQAMKVTCLLNKAVLLHVKTME